MVSQANSQCFRTRYSTCDWDHLCADCTKPGPSCPPPPGCPVTRDRHALLFVVSANSVIATAAVPSISRTGVPPLHVGGLEGGHAASTQSGAHSASRPPAPTPCTSRHDYSHLETEWSRVARTEPTMVLSLASDAIAHLPCTVAGAGRKRFPHRRRWRWTSCPSSDAPTTVTLSPCTRYLAAHRPTQKPF